MTEVFMSRLISPRWLIVSLVIQSVISGAAISHTTRGHNVVEASAYKNLLKKGRGEIPKALGYSGKEILDYLISTRVLRVPPCYPHAGKKDFCNSYTEADSLEWLPVVGSGDMDAVMYRQFSKNGQYFHFMASPGAIYRNPEVDPRTGAPRGLTEEAYPIAVRFITGMYYEILERSDISKKYYRDIYSLIHTIGDSYSEAHAQRDTTTWAIKYLKPWQATAWQPYLVYWSGWPYYLSDKIHWFPEDDRDKMYMKPAIVPQAEVDFYDKNPYVVPREYLNERGIQAANAIEDLIVITFVIMKEAGDDKAKLKEAANREWRWYLNEHFRGYTDAEFVNTVGFSQAPSDEQEWRPMIQMGLRFRTGTFSNSDDFLLAMNFAKPPSFIDPFGFAAGYEIGKRYKGPQQLWVGSISFGLYLWHYSDLLALGLDPTIADLSWDGNRLTVDPLISFVRFDAWISRRIWISVEGFRYSLVNGWRKNEFSITAGVAFSRDFPFHWTDWLSEPKYLASETSPAGESWKYPELDSPLRLNPSKYGLFHPFGYGFHKQSGHITIVPIGYTFLKDYDREAKFSRWAYGFHLGAGGEHNYDNVWMFFRAGPVLRFKIIPLIALSFEPVTARYAVGLSKDAGGYFDAEATFGAVLMLGTFDVGLELVRYSYKLGELDQKWIAGLRFGVLRE